MNDAPSISASDANTWLVDTVKAVALPAVVKPAMSSTNSFNLAIMARAESLTDEGACPSAQLMLESAFELVAAVFDQA
ncbi:MAG TPA: hypothetical protein VK620_25395 [Bradyrhizobium sp.]|nr:hypothetical protein [Bradyrhizobium sp.]